MKFMDAIRKLSRVLEILIVISSVVVGCGMVAYLASEVFRAPNPPSQVISEKFNLCIDFEGNPGSGEETLMYTHRCDIPLTEFSIINVPIG